MLPQIDKLPARPNEADVKALMRASKSEAEWKERCDQVKAAFGGQYPSYWFDAVIRGGSLDYARAMNGW